MFQKPRPEPPPAPPGYDIVEDEGRFYPARLPGGFAWAGEDKKGTRLNEVPEEVAGQRYYFFQRAGQRHGYDHPYPARYFLHNWAELLGVERLHAAWQQSLALARQGASAAEVLPAQQIAALGACLRLTGTCLEAYSSGGHLAAGALQRVLRESAHLLRVVDAPPVALTLADALEELLAGLSEAQAER
jgi:hypothetical protein